MWRQASGSHMQRNSEWPLDIGTCQPERQWSSSASPSRKQVLLAPVSQKEDLKPHTKLWPQPIPWLQPGETLGSILLWSEFFIVFLLLVFREYVYCSMTWFIRVSMKSVCSWQRRENQPRYTIFQPSSSPFNTGGPRLLCDESLHI